jgi:hypothetical protein
VSDDRTIDRPPDSAGMPRPGITEWRNERNSFFVLRLHYTADPGKRSPQWKAKTSEGLTSRAWQREYEISWTSPEGEPVVPEFDANRHVRELCPFNTPLDQLLPIVKAISLDMVTRSDYFDAGDPEVDSVGSLGSIAELLSRHSIHMHTNRPGKEISYAGLRDRFLKSVYIPRIGHDPAILISPRCPNLIEALSGGFHLSSYPPYRPVKAHPMKDLVDALRYGFDNLDSAGADRAVELKKLASGDRAW